MKFRSALVAVLWTGAASAAPELGSPVDCALGRDCFIQNHVDLKAGPGALDPFCGALTYDGHEGVDIRLRSLKDLERAPPAARAMAEGVVVAADDSRVDQMLSEGESLFPGDCGNGVTLDHGEGWRTQYCHLALGSVAVRVGERVERGRVLGRMGVSGASAFAHLHVAVKKGAAPVDPFTGRALGQGAEGCGADAAPLWSADSGFRGYVQGPTVLGFGLAGLAPLLGEVETDPAALPGPRAGEERIYVWASLLAARMEDEIRLVLMAPDGRRLAEEAYSPLRPSGLFFAHMGVAPKEADYEAWPAGRYGARLVWTRGGAEILHQEAFSEATSKP